MRLKTKKTNKIIGYSILVVMIETVCVLAVAFSDNKKYDFLESLMFANGAIVFIMLVVYAALLAGKLINE